MKARIKPYLSAKEQKALEVEIHRQCVEATAEYERDGDTLWFYALHKRGWGKKRLKELYRDIFEARRELEAYYKGEKHDNMAETAMRHKLLADGIDVDEIRKCGEDRFVVTLTK